MGMRLKNGNWSDSLADTPANQAAYGNGSGSWNGTQTTGQSGGGGGGGTPSAPSAPGTAQPQPSSQYSVSAPGGGSISGSGNAPASLVQAVTDYYNALQTGNKAAADEAIKEFNQNYELTKAATTGTFNGSPTQAALQQAADIAAKEAALTGTFNGAPTLAAEKQASDLAEQQYQRGLSSGTLTGWYNGQATLGEQQLGLDALKATAAMQNDPFRQQQYMQGLSAGGYSRAIDAMNGNTAYAASQGGQGPSAADTHSMGYLGSVVGGYGGTAGQALQPGQYATPPGVGSYGQGWNQQQPGGPGLVTPVPNASAVAPQPPSETVDSLLSRNPSLGDPAYQQVLLQSRGFVFWPGENLGANGRPTTGQYPNTAPPASATDGTVHAMGAGGITASQQAAQLAGAYDPAHMAQFYANAMAARQGQKQQVGQQQDDYTAYAQGGSAMGTGSATGASPMGTGSASPMGTGTSTYNASLNALPDSANKIVGANYLKADPATQQFITSGMSAKTGLDQATIDQQIRKTMPGFNAPSFGLSNT